MIPAGLQSRLTEELAAAWVALPDKPDETPASTMDALILKAGEYPAVLEDLVRRRIAGEPLSYLTGRQMFFGIEMLAGPEALIPRKETEIVCRGGLSKLPADAPCTVIDVCCGAGNLGLAIASRLPHATVAGSDLSEAAVDLANRNAAFLGLASRVSFKAGDLFSAFVDFGQVDLVICNPPYISSARVDQMPREIAAFEPRLAFDGGPFGVRILTRLVREARTFLKPEGWLAFEVGLGQGAAMRKILDASPLYRDIESLPDEAGETRALLARAAAASA